MGGKKITGSPRAELKEFWGRSSAKKFFHEKKIVMATHFNSIWWDGYEKAMEDILQLSAHLLQSR